MKTASRVVVGFALVALVAVSRAAAVDAPTDVPDDLKVNGAPVARVQAKGDQIYTWDGKAWKLKAPDATFDGGGVKGKHYAGPTWEADDGSKVMGKKLVEHKSPDADAVGWLLIGASSHEGHGVLADVTYVQRIHTTGGKAPSDPGKQAGDEARVHCRVRLLRPGRDHAAHTLSRAGNVQRRGVVVR